ncbi:hypothetical protein L211DRAFT_724165 [Terfezia boudieri ATCC MYA-4762]|uniref:RanBD1 domain-containing protein n=1 Tax=Terfezia boudieri ATCC MYA-4762 TaxID=1051890 RepID=A0A3N4L6I8_9PEZI|nr:hypothetical protein L211DRAFT_724165 [Terfezia boudieri ATCC MYA-4762]
MKSTNPFALLNSTTPAGKPPAEMLGTTTPFGSTTPAGTPGMPATPAGQPIFGGSTIKFPAPEETKGQASDSPLAKPTFGGVSEFNFPTLAAKKGEAGEAAKLKPTFGGVSEFNFPTLAGKKDEAGEAAKPKPTFGGVSTFSFPEPVAKNDGETTKQKPTFGGVSTFNFPEPVAKNSSDAGKPQSTFGGVPTSGIFAQKDKVTEDKLANPFAGMLGPKGAITQAAAPTKPFAASAPAPASGALFGNLSSTASAGLFGSEAKIGETKKVGGGIFGSSTSGASAPATGNKHEESSKPVSRDIFGVKTSISLNASSTTGEISYPALPSTSTASTAPSVTTNGNTTLTQLNQVPPPCEDLTEAQREEFDRQYKVRTLNFSFLNALQDSDVNTADLRLVFREYEKLYEHIMHGTKRKDESQENGTALSPKRSKTDETKPAASSAASVFGAIVDKNIGQPAASTAKEGQPKSVFGGFNSQLKNTPTAEKPTVTPSTFGNSFATSPVATNADSTKPPKATSMLFGAGGGAAVSAPAHTSGGLFSDLKPILRDQKDRGEEDSPEKLKSGGLLFGAKPTDGPPVFSFQTESTATPEKPSSGFTFGTPRAEGDQTWKPDTPIKFGGSSSAIFGSQSSTNTAPSQTLNFTSQETAATTAPSDASQPPFSFTSNNSLARPFVSQNASFDGITSSGTSTPGATNDTGAPASTTSAEVTKLTEPSDEVHADKTDMSGPGPGEENDEVLYSVRVAVYIKDDHGAMKKVAVGVSRVLKDKDTMKTRFLVRTEQGKVVVNVRLQEGVQYTPVPDKKVILIPDFSSGQKPKVYTVRTKESSAVVELGRIIAEVKG